MTTRICPTCHEQIDSDELFCPRDGTRLLKPSVYAQIAAEADPLVGTRVAERYLVIRRVGEGGMGDVYLGEHEEIEKKVAIKILKQEYSSRKDIVARFRQEAISASRIEHPNVVDVFDFGQLTDGRFYLVMEWLDGQDLATLLGEEGKLRPYRAIPIAVQACKALEAAHRNGVIHRDLKPENIFLVRNEETDSFVKIVDFGIAKLNDTTVSRDSADKPRKLTKTGMVFGTPEYMSPEQAKGVPADIRSDVYAMGIVVFEMITGQVPFFGDTFLAVLTAHLTQVPPLLNDVLTGGFVSNDLERVVSKALAKNPDERFQDMKQLWQALLDTPEGKTQAPMTTGKPSQAPVSLTKPKKSKKLESSTKTIAQGNTEMQVELPGAADSSRQNERGHGRTLALGLVALVAIASAGGALWYFGPGRETSQKHASQQLSAPRNELPPAASTPHAPMMPSSSTSVTATGSSKTPSPASSTSNNPVIHVVTRPVQAVISKLDGKKLFQVCATTPCDYPAEPNEKITFIAHAPGLEGTAAVLARRSQDVTIVLRPVRRSGTTKRTPPKTKKKPEATMCRYCEPAGDPDCLYVLRPCKPH